MGPHAKNRAARSVRGKQETLTLPATVKTEICSFELEDACGGAEPIGIYYEVISPPTTPAGAVDGNALVEVTVEWGYGQARWSRVFFVANGPSGQNLIGSSPNQGKATVWGDWARVSARLAPASLFSVPITGDQAIFGAQVGPATPGNSDHITAWFFGDTAANGNANGLIVMPPLGQILPPLVAPLTLWRLVVQNGGNVGFWAQLFDQSGNGAPATRPALEAGFVAPNGVSSFDMLLSGKGFTVGCVFAPSSTAMIYTALAGTSVRLDYELLVL